jgi:hypothetical protein
MRNSKGQSIAWIGLRNGIAQPLTAVACNVGYAAWRHWKLDPIDSVGELHLQSSRKAGGYEEKARSPQRAIWQSM